MKNYLKTNKWLRWMVAGVLWTDVGAECDARREI